MNGNDTQAKLDRTARPSELAQGISIVAALGVFGLLAYSNPSTPGVLVAITLGALSGAVLWWALSTTMPRRHLDGALDTLTQLGTIPLHDQPAPTLSNSNTAAAYVDAVHMIQDQTTGRVLLLTSPSPGQGATTVALNLAIAATRLGRRVMLIDADTTHHGLARFLSTGSTPGLTELASGELSLSEVARMLTIDETVQLPLIPAGSPDGDDSLLGGLEIGDAIDRVSERADLIIIDAPPIGWSDATPHLAVHADGSILVVTPNADPTAATKTATKLADVGAPPLGFIVNRAGGQAPPPASYVAGSPTSLPATDAADAMADTESRS
ncbi:MAG: hypothetical protein DWP92_00350 [Armatimonadetes bacterium]|nr:MAG: hypothetical protein DWP92_00350 [Armatimonadota bacterium]